MQFSCLTNKVRGKDHHLRNIHQEAMLRCVCRRLRCLLSFTSSRMFLNWLSNKKTNNSFLFKYEKTALCDWMSHMGPCWRIDFTRPFYYSSVMWLTPRRPLCAATCKSVKSVKMAPNADVTFSSQTNSTTERFCRLLTTLPCEWGWADGESTQNANRLVATDWITPLFTQCSCGRPTVGICQGRRSCRSFIRPTMQVSLPHHIIWLPACAASTMTHDHRADNGYSHERHAFSLLGVWC